MTEDVTSFENASHQDFPAVVGGEPGFPSVLLNPLYLAGPWKEVADATTGSGR